MKFYKVLLDEINKSAQYFCTKKDAHDRAKELSHPELRIELVSIANDQETTASVLSGWGCHETVEKTWRLSPRGGLVECPNGE